jgi:putative tricarboxylic transport membrane protein
MDPILLALTQALSLEAIAAIVVGSFIGLVFGSIPGLTFSMALALVIPITFTMPVAPAIGMLLGTYIGGMTGGSVSAILIGIPGTPSAAATVLDGYPLARNGRASLALGTAVLSSTFGGLFGLAVMMVSVDVVARIALSFGPAEIFALVVFGLSTICGLAGGALLRGLIAGVIGLLVMTIGLDQLDGVPRMTFGSTTMLQGVDLLVAMIGLFAIPQIMHTFIAFRAGRSVRIDARGIRMELPSLRLLKANFLNMMRSAAIGTGIGAIPGTGGPIAAFLAYDQARRFSKNRDNFGKGEISGVVAPEAANNAVTGGTMIPLLGLGIPGDPATAIILGGLLIHGVNPGPMLFVQSPEIVYGIYFAIIIAYLAIVSIQLFGIRIFVRALQIPPHLLAVALLVMCVVGSFAIRNSFLDVYTMIAIGLIGYLMERTQIPVTPVLLGLVLGVTLEREFRTALALSEGSLDIFYTSPAAMFFFALALLVIGLQASGRMKPRQPKQQET